jgi:hypothetical protein
MNVWWRKVDWLELRIQPRTIPRDGSPNLGETLDRLRHEADDLGQDRSDVTCHFSDFVRNVLRNRAHRVGPSRLAASGINITLV